MSVFTLALEIISFFIDILGRFSEEMQSFHCHVFTITSLPNAVPTRALDIQMIWRLCLRPMRNIGTEVMTTTLVQIRELKPH